MEVLRDLEGCPHPPQGTVVTIGAYDGVHRGHQAVIAEVRRRAEGQGMAAAVVTFDRHPAMVVRPESAPKLLTDLDQKLELLAATGVDYTLVVHFDEQRSREPATHFVTEVLVRCLHARHVVVGEDFHFGHQRKGDVALLEELGREHGFEVSGLGLVDLDGHPVPAAADAVSSTAIRRALVDGDLVGANQMLGHHYEVRGEVQPGDQRGRELGFPTANLAISGDILLPADGVYAGWYERPDGAVHPTAISLGRRPTFYETAHASLLEAHLLDFSGDLYGERAKVRFVGRIRGQEAFSSVDDLIERMHIDCDDARRMLSR